MTALALVMLLAALDPSVPAAIACNQAIDGHASARGRSFPDLW